MAFECDFDFLSREQNEKLAAFINEMREFADNGSSEFVRVSRELKAVAKERDNYKAMLSGASKACEDLRREYKAFRTACLPPLRIFAPLGRRPQIWSASAPNWTILRRG